MPRKRTKLRPDPRIGLQGRFGILSGLDAAGDLAQHGLEWFTFNNNTYLLEQANSKGSAYASGDTLIELVGVHNEATATFNATTHVLTL